MSRPKELLTEAILASTQDLDQLSTREVLLAIHREDRRALEALEPLLPAAEEAVAVLTGVLEAGGRWFNVGAGTSGRIGGLDAAEIPPTFGLPPERIVAVVAGGDAAMLRAQEGAEDDGPAAVRALRDHGLCASDAVLAISASGRTPFAVAGLEEARRVGAAALVITCDPDSPLARAGGIALVPQVGPEVIAGSTRMKGGLVQKALLHMLSTAVMVKMGRVEGNLMTHLRPGSEKLKRRAERILMNLGGLDHADAVALLEEHGGELGEAMRALRARRR
ncbi:MAG: N-acetylmuramic acid 6-phosphate etherase [Myxococcota bacterium]|nr:N-acetylmuramic acid 6-phosphate etherase [Myxococcota bacterium]